MSDSGKQEEKRDTDRSDVLRPPDVDIYKLLAVVQRVQFGSGRKERREEQDGEVSRPPDDLGSDLIIPHRSNPREIGDDRLIGLENQPLGKLCKLYLQAVPEEPSHGARCEQEWIETQDGNIFLCQ